MSGTSLDGLDIAACKFSEKGKKYHYELLACECIEYDEILKIKLQKSHNLSAENLLKLNIEFGEYTAKTILNFIQKNNLTNVKLIASHGHTVFHRPENSLTYQIGSGAVISAVTGIPTVSDFRSTDIALNGQGAPLVPIGDELLFGDYQACLNLGGFANISYRIDNKRIAFDICPVNIVLNKFAEQLEKKYDDKGHLAKQGRVIIELFQKLNTIKYYKQKAPKSLSREWLEQSFLPIFSEFNNENARDILSTLCEHIASQIISITNEHKNVLITGGGAFNNHLIERLKMNSKTEFIIPDNNIVMFKEAIVFAFLGYLRWHAHTNCLASVTGAVKDSSSGAVYL